jgi:predicted ATPase
LRDHHPERFEALNDELGRWIPEFDRVLFTTPREGHRSVALRTRRGRHPIQAGNLSQGTLVALALLTLAFLPEPPPIIGLEEPDHGLRRYFRTALAFSREACEAGQRERTPSDGLSTGP